MICMAVYDLATGDLLAQAGPLAEDPGRPGSFDIPGGMNVPAGSIILTGVVSDEGMLVATLGGRVWIVDWPQRWKWNGSDPSSPGGCSVILKDATVTSLKAEGEDSWPTTGVPPVAPSLD